MSLKVVVILLFGSPARPRDPRPKTGDEDEDEDDYDSGTRRSGDERRLLTNDGGRLTCGGAQGIRRRCVGADWLIAG
jgi:hypothetical protein